MRTLRDSLLRGCAQLVGRRVYIFAMAVVPLGLLLMFTTLMSEGLPLPVPVALVDRDGSPMSREMTRNLTSGQYVSVVATPEDYSDAMDLVKEGKVFGFFLIPTDFQQKALAGENPSLSFYCNMSVFVPGTMSFKGFKSTAVSTKGGMVETSLTSVGVGESTAATMLQPVVIQSHPLHNPWMSYSIYLNNSFIPGVLALMVLLVTAYSITSEIKYGTSRQWLAVADNRMWVALVGKLAPQTVVLTVVGLVIQVVFYRLLHYPLLNHWGHMALAMLLLVMACQGFAVICTEICPNLRMSLILCALVGILSFSITGFSFPVEQMYGGVAVFSYIVPLRYYFLIYVDQALNGIPIYYSRVYYAALLLFPLLALPMLPRLKKRMLNPVYVA